MFHTSSDMTSQRGSKRKAATADDSESEGAKYDEPDTEPEDEADKHRPSGWWRLADAGCFF